MTNWILKIDIKNEIKALKEFCENFSDSYIYEGENENTYINLAKKLESKFQEYEEKIKEVTDDDGTWEDLENNLNDLVMSANVENSNYNMDGIYNICDDAGIWLIQ